MNGDEINRPDRDANLPNERTEEDVIDGWFDDTSDWGQDTVDWAELGGTNLSTDDDDDPTSHPSPDELEPWDVSVPEGTSSSAPLLQGGRYTDVMIAGETPDIGWEPLDPWAPKSTSAAIPFRTASGQARAVVLLTVDPRQEVTRYFSYATDEDAQAVARLLDPVEPSPPNSPDLVRKEWFVDPRTCQKHLDQVAR